MTKFDEVEGMVQYALRSTYHLHPTASGKLRRMSKAAGLANENVLSRLALSRSLAAGEHVDLSNVPPGGKEIKGSTLFGRPATCAMFLTVMARRQDEVLEHGNLRAVVEAHWERGLTLLSKETRAGSALDWTVGEVLKSRSQEAEEANDGPRERPRGLGVTEREVVAGEVRKAYPSWPTEVQRLVAMVGRLDVTGALTVAAELRVAVDELSPGARVSESLMLRVLRESWGINRLGLNAADRRLLRHLADVGGLRNSEVPESDHEGLGFLEKMGLIANMNGQVVLTPSAQSAGPELWAL